MELERYIYPQKQEIQSYKCKKTQELGFESADPAELDWETFRLGDEWSGHREYYWFVTDVEVPESFAGSPVVFRLTTGREGSWDATNPQFRMYLDGKLFTGLDVNHRTALLTAQAKAGQKFRIALRAFTGDHNTHLQLVSGIAAADRDTEKLYYDIKVPYEVAKLLDKEDDTRIDTIGCLNDTVNLLDLRQPFTAEYAASVRAALDYIDGEFYRKRCGASKEEVWCVGHTHIDVAWLWTLAVTRDKALRSFSTVLSLMKEYPDYIFMSSQPQLYKFVKAQSPELFEQIKERVKEGRWEPEGGMFLEADCNIASGESLVRQILFGKRFFKEEFGADSKVLWLPDVFGYSAALPQILQRSGIPYFMTTKISWNDTDKLPYDTFMWKGIDGSKVLSHFIPASDYTSERFFTTYNGMLEPLQIKGAWKRYQQKALNNKVLFSFGYGDGGGGPTREMLENHKRLAKGIPGSPKTVMATSRQFFERLESDVKDNRFLPTWSGELYLEFHRGTYTTMARNKKFNRKSEFTYQNAELYSSMRRALTGAAYPQQAINDGWEVILRNQFHDILPGSSIKEVYEDSKEEYRGILAKGGEMIDGALKGIVSGIGGTEPFVTVFNPNGFPLSDVVAFTLPAGVSHPQIVCRGGDGAETLLPCQIAADGRALFVARDVPPKGYRTFSLRQAAQETAGETALSVSATGFSNRFYDVRLDEKACIVSLYDKAEGREVVVPGKRANVLTAYEDKPFEYDAWNIEQYYSEKSWEVDDVESVEVVERGPVRGALRVTRRFQDSTIVQTLYVYADLARIDVKNHIDWKARQVLLRVSFPVDIHAEEATYEIQYGNVKRPAHFNTSWDQARFEVCAHKWMDFSEDGYGVSVLNDCKYGCDVHNGVMSLSLLKSPYYPNPDADREQHEFVYSIVPHAGGWREAGTVQSAYALNNPLTAVAGSAGGGSLPQSYSLVACDAPNVVVEVVKKAEDSDCTVVRMYECYNRRSDVTVTFAGEMAQVSECNLMESVEGDAPEKLDAHRFRFTIRPYEIRTFMLRSAE